MNNKIEYIWKDATDLLARLGVLLEQAWNLGMDIAKLIVQICTIWELFWNTGIAKKVGLFLSGLKFR